MPCGFVRSEYLIAFRPQIDDVNVHRAVGCLRFAAFNSRRIRYCSRRFCSRAGALIQMCANTTATRFMRPNSTQSNSVFTWSGMSSAGGSIAQPHSRTTAAPSMMSLLRFGFSMLPSLWVILDLRAYMSASGGWSQTPMPQTAVLVQVFGDSQVATHVEEG